MEGMLKYLVYCSCMMTTALSTLSRFLACLLPVYYCLLSVYYKWLDGDILSTTQHAVFCLCLLQGMQAGQLGTIGMSVPENVVGATVHVTATVVTQHGIILAVIETVRTVFHMRQKDVTPIIVTVSKAVVISCK